MSIHDLLSFLAGPAGTESIEPALEPRPIPVTEFLKRLPPNFVFPSVATVAADLARRRAIEVANASASSTDATAVNAQSPQELSAAGQARLDWFVEEDRAARAARGW